MGPKFYILVALPFIVIAGVFAFMFWVARAKSPRAAGWAEKLGVLNGAGRADEMERMIQLQSGLMGISGRDPRAGGPELL